MNQVLFLCSRNICSSQVAAALFNHAAMGYLKGRFPVKPLSGWKAISRGLEVDPLGDVALSPNAIGYLNQQEIAVNQNRLALSVEPSDLLWSDRIIALNEEDHRPIIEDRFAFWSNRIEYWNVPDFHESNWGKALPRLESNIFELLAVIRSSEIIASF